MARKLLRFFWEMFQIALCVLGGGFAIIAVADDVFSRKLKWTKEGEILDHLPIFQMVPGLIAGNTAVYVGHKIAGALGAAVGLIAVALPSLIIFLGVSVAYQSLPLDNRFLVAAFVGLRASLTGVVVATLVRTWLKSITDAFSFIVMALAAVALMAFSVNPSVLLFIAMVVGLIFVAWREGRFARQSRLSSFFFIPLFFLKYGALCFGGGYVLVPFYLKDFVGPDAPYLQLPVEEFSNLMALTQMTPGPIGVNAATFFGYRMGGVWGAVVATICLLLPGYCFLLLALRSIDRFKTSLIVKGLLRGVRPVSVALILMASWAFLSMSVWDLSPVPHTSWCTFSSFNINVVATLLTLATGILFYLHKVSVMKLILLSACVGCVLVI